MIVIDTGIYDPFFNITAEEFLFRKFTDEVCFLYINDKSVIIGKHQNIYEEINLKYIRQNQVPVIRRISGGGTVYHDGGNLNFTFIRNTESGKQIDFSKYVSPVVSFFKTMGLNPEVGAKNEISEGGLKFSGNAEHIFRNRVLHHGTILYSSNLADMKNALEQGKGIFKSKGVQSNRTRTGNLDKKLGNIKDIGELKDKLIKYIISNIPDTIPYVFSGKEIIEIQELSKTKYKTWDWNYAYGPEYTFTNTIKILEKEIEISLKVKNGIITKCTIGEVAGWSGLSQKILGAKHLFEDIRSVLKDMALPYNDEIVYSFLR